MALEIPREQIFDSKEFDMDNLRKEWREKLVKELSGLIEPAKILHELSIKHPDISYLLDDVIQVLQGNDGARSYLSAHVSLDLFRLYGLLQWLTKNPESSEATPTKKSNVHDNSSEVNKDHQVINALRIPVSPGADYEK